MILAENVVQIGQLLKPHGVKGEMTLLFNRLSHSDIDTPYYFLEIDGIFVPFFVEEIRFTNDTTARVKFEGVDDVATASRYADLRVYLPKESLTITEEETKTEWDFFVGYTVIDQTLGNLGVIDAVDDSTMNVLFVVKKNNAEYLIPAAEDFILEMDEQEKILHVDLPQGLIEEE
ncbi:MAG TPA: ribosome maturation factor RimM [Dysgonamonadaceae bacterium]|nr:ribosome maturation factor RimM [Dysgonamonadaceae bacterium]